MTLESKIRHPALRCLWDYWHGKKKRRARVSRADFDPIELPTWAWPNLFLIEVAGTDYVLRVQGSYICDAYRRDFTGCRLVDEEIPGVSNSFTLRAIQQMTNDPSPRHVLGQTEFRPGYALADIELVVLPLLGSNGIPTHFLGALDYPYLREPFPRYLPKDL